VGTESRRNEDALIATGTRRRPGRIRVWVHRLVGAIGWIALLALAVWRLPESPPWRLPLPIGLMLLAFAALLVLAALLWARMADRRRRPRPGPAKTPPRSPRRRPVPDRVTR
jgi:heme A synthase